MVQEFLNYTEKRKINFYSMSIKESLELFLNYLNYQNITRINNDTSVSAYTDELLNYVLCCKVCHYENENFNDYKYCPECGRKVLI